MASAISSCFDGSFGALCLSKVKRPHWERVLADDEDTGRGTNRLTKLIGDNGVTRSSVGENCSAE